MEDTITLTEAELNAKIEEAVSAKTKEIVSKHNGEMATLRTKLKEAEKKAMSDEERQEYEKKAKEEVEAKTLDELNELRSYKKSNELSKRLDKEGLPEHYKYDTRLINADEENFEKVLKTVKSEYESTQPKGNQHSSVIRTGVDKPTGGDEKEIAYGEMGQLIGKALAK